MTITLRTYLTNEGTAFDTEIFDNNADIFKTFFEDKAEIDIKVVGDFGECEEDAVAVKCMMNDIKQESSYIFKCLSPIIDAESVNDLKVKMLKFLLERYFPCIHNYNTYFNDENYSQYASYYYEERFLYFKYLLPQDLIQKCSEKMPDDKYLDLSKLSAEELATYVIPNYYSELAAWDREFIRNDKELMDFLSIIWFMQAKNGRLD